MLENVHNSLHAVTVRLKAKRISRKRLRPSGLTAAPAVWGGTHGGAHGPCKYFLEADLSVTAFRGVQEFEDLNLRHWFGREMPTG